jgi:hypothetical protein
MRRGVYGPQAPARDGKDHIWIKAIIVDHLGQLTRGRTDVSPVEDLALLTHDGNRTEAGWRRHCLRF